MVKDYKTGSGVQSSTPHRYSAQAGHSRGGSGHEVTNADVLTALLTLSEGIKNIVSDAVGEHLAGVVQITKTIVDVESFSVRGLKKELTEMMHHIEITRNEIASLRPASADDDQIIMASNELDAVVEATETATTEILEQSEKMQELVGRMRQECGAGDTVNMEANLTELEDIATQLMISCGFQDLTGQRITKVINTLKYIELHINAMMKIWEIEQGTGDSNLMINAPDDQRPDKDLLNGPQMNGGGVSQDDIDALFN
ncbi:MAG: protein phosphatase CheZ [Alphaproteobacteria bacterium]|nr:protein phosphatase CheZ [Alphaproteobacteria bacterium]